MGTRCRNGKKKVKGLGRRSKDTAKITDKMINKLQKYYGLAILRRQDSVEEMYKEIWVTYFHMGSTDNKPHQNCPAGADSWCKYRRAEAEGFDMTKFRHYYLPLDSAVLEMLHPIYTNLSRAELLNRCKGCNTQNNN